MKITVDACTACIHCPLLQGGGEPADGGEEMHCGADTKERELPFDAYWPGDRGEDRVVPDWCPLRGGPVTVEMGADRCPT